MNNRTVLEMVKRVLSDLNFEQVNSIYETDDALAVARIVLNVHSAILSEYPWVIKDALIKPLKINLTTVSVPSSTQRVRKVKYIKSKKCDKKQAVTKPAERASFGSNASCVGVQSTSCHSAPYDYFLDQPFGSNSDSDADCEELMYLEMDDFLKTCSFDDGCLDDCPDSGEITYSIEGCKMVLNIPSAPGVPKAPIKYQTEINNNKDPEYWTVINGDIVLDSFCYKDGTRLQERRLVMIGSTVAELGLNDNQRISLPTEFYNYLVAEVLSTANYNLLGRANEKEENRSQRLRRRLLREHGLQARERTSIDYKNVSTWRK